MGNTKTIRPFSLKGHGSIAHSGLIVKYQRKKESSQYEKHRKTFIKNNPPIHTNYIKEMLRVILKDNSFHINGENYLQIHATATGNEMAVAFQISLWMILSKSVVQPMIWKRYVDDIFSV